MRNLKTRELLQCRVNERDVSRVGRVSQFDVSFLWQFLRANRRAATVCVPHQLQRASSRQIRIQFRKWLACRAGVHDRDTGAIEIAQIETVDTGCGAVLRPRHPAPLICTNVTQIRTQSFRWACSNIIWLWILRS